MLIFIAGEKKMKQKLLKAGVAGLVLLTGGCYEYTKPLADFSQSSYSQRPKEANADLLKGIKQLTLADAQRICIGFQACLVVIPRPNQFYIPLGIFDPFSAVIHHVAVGGAQNTDFDCHMYIPHSVLEIVHLFFQPAEENRQQTIEDQIVNDKSDEIA